MQGQKVFQSGSSLTRLNRFFGTGSSGENVGNSRIKTVSDLESKLKPGIPKGKGIRKEIISNGNLWKDNHPITVLRHQIRPSGQGENRENVGNNRIKDDSDQGKHTVKESQ